MLSHVCICGGPFYAGFGQYFLTLGSLSLSIIDEEATVLYKYNNKLL